MNRKILVAIFLLIFAFAQVGNASAATVEGTATLVELPTFSNIFDVDLEWSVSGMPGGATQNIFVWGRQQAAPSVAYDPSDCRLAASLPGVSDAAGTYTYQYFFSAFDQQTWEFTLTVDDAVDCNSATLPSTNSVMGSTFIDGWWLDGFIANPPSLDPAFFEEIPVACNTFELWGLVTDRVPDRVAKTHGGEASTLGYSGFASWNQSITGTFTPPAPLGPPDALLSWVYTFPSTASGLWSFSVDPTDYAGNNWGTTNFRYSFISEEELADCVTFSDVSETDTEIYVRYMADLDLAHGYLDGTFLPDATLTRAEMAAFIELANGIQGDDPEFATPPPSGSACDFSDVSSDDWFAGWVWQACADGYMNGIGNGLFDPNNYLTRGQVVTVLDNINKMGTGSGYLATQNVFQGQWGNLYREAVFLDVAVGDFYAGPVQRAFGVGVVDGTSDTTFSPDQAILRGEFIKWMYRTLSRIQPGCVECQ
ncbi:MAG TPA: S-layer homology domain-containing protein [Anaerolineales bacterium]|nr:S-layer homology domain-containing protein [Anaerolineales bacterium]